MRRGVTKPKGPGSRPGISLRKKKQSRHYFKGRDKRRRRKIPAQKKEKNPQVREKTRGAPKAWGGPAQRTREPPSAFGPKKKYNAGKTRETTRPRARADPISKDGGKRGTICAQAQQQKAGENLRQFAGDCHAHRQLIGKG